MIKLGIECENLEDSKSRWGVGQITLNLLEEYARNLEWQKKFKIYLYFKKNIPNDEVFKNPIFTKRVLKVSSFNIFYHIAMPIRAMMDRLDWMFFPPYMLPPLYLGRSVVMLTDDVYYEYKSGNLPFRYRLAYRLFTNWAAIKATKILAISETSKEEVARLYSIRPERIFVSHLGIRQHQTHDQKPVSPYILYVGQMFPRRHAKETIMAFGKIASEFPELKLVMIGKDKYPSPIEELIKETNEKISSERIVHHDYIEKIENLDKLYSGARALVYISDREAFGLPPMEALSFGVPPVIMDNKLGHELFGNYAFYSKDGEVEQIAEAIRGALKDEEKIKEIRSEGQEFSKKYNWKSFADKFFNAIEK